MGKHTIMESKMKQVIRAIVKFALKITVTDQYNNQQSKVVLKAIFGALRPWWLSAYDSCLNGDTFNVPELHLHESGNPYRGFKDHHHDILNTFCQVIAEEFGYVNSDEEWNNEPDDSDADAQWLDNAYGTNY